MWGLETQSTTQPKILDTNVCYVTHYHTKPLETKRAQKGIKFSHINIATNIITYDFFTEDFVTYLQSLLGFAFHSVFGQPGVK